MKKKARNRKSAKNLTDMIGNAIRRIFFSTAGCNIYSNSEADKIRLDQER